LKQRDLIPAPNHFLISAANEFKDKIAFTIKCGRRTSQQRLLKLNWSRKRNYYRTMELARSQMNW